MSKENEILLLLGEIKGIQTEQGKAIVETKEAVDKAHDRITTVDDRLRGYQIKMAGFVGGLILVTVSALDWIKTHFKDI